MTSRLKLLFLKRFSVLSVSSDPEAGSHVTDSVSLPACSCRLDSIYLFKGDSFDISVTIEDFKFPALIEQLLQQLVLKFGTSILVIKIVV